MPPDSLPLPTEASKRRFLGRRLLLLLLTGCTLTLPTPTTGQAAEVATVISRVSDDYFRDRLPCGKVQPEPYAFGQGGYISGGMSDPTIEQVRFVQLAQALAKPLAKQDFIPARDPNQTRLLIVVYWGMTNGAGGTAKRGTGPDLGLDLEHPSFHDILEARNAAILGYESVLSDYVTRRGSALEFRSADPLAELECNRYFVALIAYDFQELWKRKRAKVLWETRFSVREQGNRFDERVAAMARDAAVFFGRDSRGLVR